MSGGSLAQRAGPEDREDGCGDFRLWVELRLLPRLEELKAGSAGEERSFHERLRAGLMALAAHYDVRALEWALLVGLGLALGMDQNRLRLPQANPGPGPLFHRHGGLVPALDALLAAAGKPRV